MHNDDQTYARCLPMDNMLDYTDSARDWRDDAWKVRQYLKDMDCVSSILDGLDDFEF